MTKKSSKRVLLVYPQCPDTFWSFKHALSFINKKASFPPLGLATVAAMLPADWDLRLIDMNVDTLADSDIEWADMVFMSAMLVQEVSARDVIARAMRLRRPIVAGGPAFTTHAEAFPGVDHFVLGEAEVTLPRFLADLDAGAAKPVYDSHEKPNLATTPLPRWDLIRMQQYSAMMVQYSRGCPFQCDFCDIIVMNGRVQRAKPPERMVAEVQAIYDAGWRGNVFIVDDNFIGNARNAESMLPKLIEWQQQHRFPFRFFTEASVNLAGLDRLMGLMQKANFHKVFLGIETPSIESLRECRKYQNAGNDLLASVRKIQSYGMQVMGGFIIGFDSDKPGVFRRQMAFIQRAGIPAAMVGLLTALPGTDLWKRLHAEGRIVDQSTGDNTDGTLNFVPRLPRDMLTDGYRRLMQHLYAPSVYYRRVGVFLDNFRTTSRGRVRLCDIAAFFRTTWRIGIFSRARFHYWRLLLKTFFTNVRAFPVAVELAVQQFHFERVAARVRGSGRG
jgi:radical SAM superfamily enzyme YgiQ (UPF0313 family)